MCVELAQTTWQLPPLDRDQCGPFGDFPRLSDAEKEALWNDYHARRHARVPTTLWTNTRIVLLDPRFNSDGLGFEQVFSDARAMLVAWLRMEYVLRMRHHLFCDRPTNLPERWLAGVSFLNVYETAALGAPIEYRTNQVPDTRPMLDDDHKHAVFELDIDHPLELALYKRGIELTHAMRKIAARATFFGRPIDVAPYAELGSDGPLTVAMNLRGPAILTDLLRDPDYATCLFDFIVTAGLKRRAAFLEYWNLPEPDEIWFADDSIAMLSNRQYRELVLPHHRTWYDTIDPHHQKRRSMHLCGDATRHFRTIRDELGVESFDTGFPVDFATLRRELGPDVELLGGVEVPKLLDGSPEEVYHRAETILKSGVLEGGRFILRDANNLPPGVPWANLAAMYRAAFDFGQRP